MGRQQRTSRILLTALATFLLLGIKRCTNARVSNGMVMNFRLSNGIKIDLSSSSRKSQINVEFSTPTMKSCGIQCSSDQYCLAFYYYTSSTPSNIIASNNLWQNSPGNEIIDTALTSTKTQKILNLNSDDGAATTQKPTSILNGGDGSSEEKNDSFKCVLFKQRIHVNDGDAISGSSNSGVLGIVRDVRILSEDDQPPRFSNAELKYATRIETGLVAVYYCTGGNKDMTTFGWRYDNVEEEWPKFPPEFETCYSTMCDFSGASATVLAVYSSDKERVMLLVECGSNEYEPCHAAVCNRKGKWSLEGNHDDIQVSCVSDKCYRAETDSGAVHYSGSLSKSITGKSCIPWYNLPHVSPEWVQEYDDNFYKVLNYCRDQDRKSGVPWCYVSDGGDLFLKEVCDVAACVWDPLVDDTS